LASLRDLAERCVFLLAILLVTKTLGSDREIETGSISQLHIRA